MPFILVFDQHTTKSCNDTTVLRPASDGLRREYHCYMPLETALFHLNGPNEPPTDYSLVGIAIY